MNKTPGKRERRVALSSSSSTDSPDNKKHIVDSTTHYRPVKATSNMNDTKIEDIKLDAKSPQWAKNMLNVLNPFTNCKMLS